MSATSRRGARWLAMILATAGVTGCGESPTAPGAVVTDVSGTWVSTDRRFRWTLTQANSTVTGTHLDNNTARVTPIHGEIAGRRFAFTVVTGQRLVTFLDPPQIVEQGWRAQADVAGRRMTGSLSTFGSGFRESITEITMRRVDSAR